MSEEGAILITGGARGLGAALTKHFATAGRDVVMNYRNADLARQVAEEASRAGAGRILAIEADVRDREQVQAMFGEAQTTFGGVTVLINCAGVNRDASFLELSDKDWDTVVDTHLKGAFICSQEFVKQLGDKPGSIINLGAACGLQGRLNGANFCSAKGGVFALTKCMARELAPRIRVNCIMPGPVIEGHADIEGDCKQCHAPLSDTLQSDLCIACHEDVGFDIRDPQTAANVWNHGLIISPDNV